MADRWLVTGASGFLGHRVATALARRGHRVVGTWRGTEVSLPGVEMVRADLSDADAVRALLDRRRPDHLFHAAAMTDVGACELDGAAAERDIVASARNLASNWRGGAAILVSTDLVFDGEGAPYEEDAAPKPLSAYGGLKLRTESLFRELPRGNVLRTALVFGPSAVPRGGFVAWMAGELRAGRPLRLFSDEYRTPVLSDDIADAAEGLADSGASGEVFHAGGPERLSRVDLGLALARAMGADEGLVRGVSLAESTFPAPRPRDVSLVSERLRHRLRWTPTRFADFLSGHFNENTEDLHP